MTVELTEDEFRLIRAALAVYTPSSADHDNDPLGVWLARECWSVNDDSCADMQDFVGECQRRTKKWRKAIPDPAPIGLPTPDESVLDTLVMRLDKADLDASLAKRRAS